MCVMLLDVDYKLLLDIFPWDGVLICKRRRGPPNLLASKANRKVRVHGVVRLVGLRLLPFWGFTDLIVLLWFVDGRALNARLR